MPEITPDHHDHYADDSVVNVETRHEESDVNVKALMWFVIVFVIFAVVTHVGIWLMFKFYVQLERGNANAPLTAIARAPDSDVPVAPRLQPFPTKAGGEVLPPYRTTPVTDMEDMRAHEQQVLSNYGWVDRTHGVVHIPIEEAKRLALQSNAFVVSNGATPPPGAAIPAAATGTSPTQPSTPPAAPGDAGSNAARAGTATTTGTQQ